MKFSIVIPAYNGEKYINDAILSALNQTRKPDEIIVHDDNSTDGTNEICKKYIGEIRYILNENGPSGFVNGWNRAIGYTKGDYISILHQDDLLYPRFLEYVEKEISLFKGVRHFFCYCDYINDTGQIISGYNLDNKKDKRKNYFYSGYDYFKAYKEGCEKSHHLHRCPGVVTHRSIFKDEITYNVNAGHIADDDFFYRIGQYTDVVGINERLAAYRMHSESETGSIGDFKLVKRLSKDYIYQLNQWKKSKFITRQDKLFFKRNAIKFNKRLLGYAMKKISFKDLINAFLNIYKISSISFK